MGIRGRLALSHFILTLVVILLIGLVTLGRFRSFLLTSAETTLSSQASEIAKVLDRRAFFERSGRDGDWTGAGLVRLASQLTAADFAVISSKGRIIAGSERLGRLSGTSFKSEALTRTLRQGLPGSEIVRDPLGRLSVIAAAPVFASDKTVAGAVALVRPVDEVARATRSSVLLILQSLALGLGLSLLASLILAHRLTRPLGALQAAAAKVATGDFSSRVAVESDDEFGRVAVGFNAMAEQLGVLQRERQELYASVSHELRTPVTSIKGFAQALEDNVGSPDDRRRHVGIILEEASRLERLVGDLFQLARLEAGQVSFDWRDVDLATLTGGAVDKYRPRAAAGGVDLVFRGEELFPRLRVRGDPDRLHQVLANLMENALRFTPTGGRITVCAGEAGGTAHQPTEAMVSVGDSGPGIADADLPRVFDRFYTVDRSRARRKGGAGLGLAIVREIVSAHRGRVWAARSPEGGALISFTIPLLG
jgi:signal transduction histidine kinase